MENIVKSKPNYTQQKDPMFLIISKNQPQWPKVCPKFSLILRKNIKKFLLPSCSINSFASFELTESFNQNKCAIVGYKKHDNDFRDFTRRISFNESPIKYKRSTMGFHSSVYSHEENKPQQKDQVDLIEKEFSEESKFTTEKNFEEEEENINVNRNTKNEEGIEQESEEDEITPDHVGYQDKDKGELIYLGALSPAIKLLKRVSLTTFTLGMIMTPLALYLKPETMPLAGTISITGVVLLFTCGPTFLLHTICKPYIFRMYDKTSLVTGNNDENLTTTKPSKHRSHSLDPNLSFRVETIDFLTREVITEFKLKDVEPLPNSVRPFTTFGLKDRKKTFFIHDTAFTDTSQRVRLYKRLAGKLPRSLEATKEES